MMDPEELQSDLLALRSLYRLLVKDEHYVEDAGSENLDNNARRLLINLLDAAANKAFDDHAKILDTQLRATNSMRSMPRDGLNLRSFSTRKAPTDAAYPSLQNVDLLTGDWNFSESTDQVDLADEPGTRLKRCRVCQKPKVKQLTKEISFRGSKALTPINRLQNQNHKRRWEVENDPSTVGGSAGSSSSQLLINLNDQEDQISKEASAKIRQLESCISSLQVASKQASFIKNKPENESKQTGRSDPNSTTSQILWEHRDMADQWHDQTPRSINELALQGPLFTTALPSSQMISQQVEEPIVNKIDMYNLKKNQYDHIPEEAYYLFPSGGISSDRDKMAEKNRYLHGNLSSHINRQQLDQLQMARKQAMKTSEMTEWSDPVQYCRPIKEQQKAEFVGRKQPGETYNDQMDHYRGKHEVVDPKRFVSAATRRLPESLVSSSNNATQNQSPNTQNLSESPSQSYNSFSVSEGSSLQDREVYSGSSRSRSREKSDSEMNSVSSQDESPYKSGSFYSSGSMSRRTVPKGGNKKGGPEEPNRKSESKMKMVLNRDPGPDISGGSDESSRSRRTVPKKGHRKGNKKEQKRRSEGKMNMVSSLDQSSYTSTGSVESSGSGSGSRTTVCRKGHTKTDQKESKRESESKMDTLSSLDQSSYTASSSNESPGSGSGSGSKSGSGSGSGSGPGSGSGSVSGSWSRSGSGSGSGSRRMIPKKGHQKGNQKEPKRKRESKMSMVSSLDQSSYTGSSSTESSGSEPKENQVGRLGKLKNKLAIIFHHHHYHHHDGSEEDDCKKVFWKNAKKVIGQGEKAVKKIEKNALPALKKCEAHGEVAVKKIEKKALPAIKKYAAHGEVAVKKIEKKALPAIKKYAAHGEHAVKKMYDKALVNKKHGAHGKHTVKKNDHKALMIKDEAHGEHAVKKNESRALVINKDEFHGEHAVRKIESKSVVINKDEGHGEHTVKKSENMALPLMVHKAGGDKESKALVLHKAGDNKESKALVHKAADKKVGKALVVHKPGGKKQTSQKQTLVGGLMKKSQNSIKSSKSKSAEKSSTSHSSRQKHSGGSSGQKQSGGGKTGQKLQWFQILRQQRKMQRLEKLRYKIDNGKVATTLNHPQ